MHSLIFGWQKKTAPASYFFLWYIILTVGLGECLDPYLLKIYGNLKARKERAFRTRRGAVSLQQICRSPDRINCPIPSTPNRINCPLNLRFHPRSKCFHGDVSAGGFALLQILGDEFGDWEVGKLETAIGLYVFSILQYAYLQVAAVVAPQFGNS